MASSRRQEGRKLSEPPEKIINWGDQLQGENNLLARFGQFKGWGSGQCEGSWVHLERKRVT